MHEGYNKTRLLSCAVCSFTCYSEPSQSVQGQKWKTIPQNLWSAISTSLYVPSVSLLVLVRPILCVQMLVSLLFFVKLA